MHTAWELEIHWLFKKSGLGKISDLSCIELIFIWSMENVSRGCQFHGIPAYSGLYHIIILEICISWTEDLRTAVRMYSKFLEFNTEANENRWLYLSITDVQRMTTAFLNYVNFMWAAFEKIYHSSSMHPNVLKNEAGQKQEGLIMSAGLEQML